MAGVPTNTQPMMQSQLSSASYLRATILGLGLALLATVCSLPAWSGLNHNSNSLKALSRTYGFLLGQEYSLKRIDKTLPSLRNQVEVARLTFGSNFAGVREKLEQELVLAMGDSNFQKLRGELEKKLAQLLGQQALTVEIAQQFLEQVRARAKGGEMETDVLR